MFLPKIVFAAITITNLVFVTAQDQDEDPESDPVESLEEEKTEPPQMDHHTFVALIEVDPIVPMSCSCSVKVCPLDHNYILTKIKINNLDLYYSIVFTDGKKRTCTGTIIHDNVVITAAHCFIVLSVDRKQYVEAELTASFVVIGTKKMYDTGYENYLPIERIITHPKFKGWTADIALVFTFAGMTTDKIGNAIPIIGENALTPVDSNVTILSWGHCKDEVPPSPTRAPGSLVPEKRLCSSSEEDHDSCEPTSTYGPHRAGYSSSENEPSSEADVFPPQSGGDKSDSLQIGIADSVTNATPRNSKNRSPKLLRGAVVKSISESELTMGIMDQTTKIISRYLSSAEDKIKKKDKKLSPVKQRIYYTPKHRYSKAYPSNNRYSEDKGMMIVKGVIGNATKKQEQPKKTENALQKYYKNWRRTMGTKENKLTIEIFGFVNVQTCKKLVDRALPAEYAINTNEVVCYAAEEHYISEEDSGSPAIRQGHLVAVTLGGVECEGDHVAIGIKMNCFCSWIAENLPSGGKDMKCCKDCCGETKKDDQKFFHRQRHVNQYLRKPKIHDK